MKRLVTGIRFVIFPWLKAAYQDVKAPIRTPLVPNRRDNYIGGGDFVKVGDQLLKRLIAQGLKPDMDVLDIGSGQGRIARPLTTYLSDKGSYTGLEIVKRGVDWCQKHYGDFPNFKFVHADIFNKAYNKKGPVLAKDYKLPFEDNSFDFIYLTSVFTHMMRYDVENYLQEIHRVLRPGGRTLITWFLFDDIAYKANEEGKAAFAFQHPFDEVSLAVSDRNPEGTIGFDYAYAMDLYKSLGFSIEEPVQHGTWSRQGGQQFQDTVIADKPRV